MGIDNIIRVARGEAMVTKGRTGRFGSKKKNTPMSTIGRFGSALAVAESTFRVGKAVHDFYKERFNFTTMVSEDDDLYPEVHKWLVAATPNERHQNIQVLSSRDRKSSGPVSENAEASSKSQGITPLDIRFNDATTRKVVIEGYRVQVTLSKPENLTIEERNYGMRKKPDEINFVSPSYPAHMAVKRLLDKLNEGRSLERTPTLKMSTRWGNWDTRSDLPPRTMESVSLPKGQKERIVADMRQFLESEDKYNRLAIPWHRGYMLHGNPGTGKTSLVKALANEFKLDLWYIALGDLESESNLMDLISRVTPRSILLLEDIDAVHISTDRDSAEQGKINTGSLLNALDGVATPHGLITFMTTNHYDRLDGALTRTGRMDLTEHIQVPSIAEVEDLYHHFYGKRAVFNVDQQKFEEKGYSASDFAEVMKRNMDDYHQAAEEIAEMF